MKQFKKIMYLLGVVSLICVLVLLGTAIVQIGMMVIAESMGVVIPEDTLYHVSGSSGIAIVSILCAIFVKKKNYVQCVEQRESLNAGKALIYMVLTVCICQVLTTVVTTALFANTIPVESPQLQGRNTYLDLIFAVLLAPIFEELLFRMGAYSLLRRKFSRVSSIIICTFIFAISHGYQIQGFISCFVAGLVLALIYDKTGNIVYSIGAHMLCNLFASVMNALEDAGVTWFGIGIQYDLNGYVMFHPIIIVIAAALCGTYFVRAIKVKRAAA